MTHPRSATAQAAIDMGSLRFELPDASQIDPLAWSTAYITGIEGLPWACRRSWNGNQLAIDRDIDESGRLNMVWPCGKYGPMLQYTSSLRPSFGRYHLPLEIARGTVHRVRSQAFDWQRMGMRLTENFLATSLESVDLFLDATIQQKKPVECQAQAQKAIERAAEAGEELANSYVDQALNYRRQSEKQLTTLLGMRLPAFDPNALPSAAIQAAANTVTIPLEWSLVEPDSGKQRYDLFDAQIQWARNQGMKICAGPLISFQPHSLPKWLFLLEHDFEALLKAACEYTASVVQRYRGKIHLWHCAGGLNAPSDLKLTDEQLLRLAVGVIQTVRRNDDRAAVLISVDQPWCEYLSFDPHGVSPLHFADALIRADLGLSGLGLEMNFNYWPGGSLPRDLLEVSRLIDRWTMLGLPLLALVSQPSSMQEDKLSVQRYRMVSQWSSNTVQAAAPLEARRLVEMLLAKQAVQGILWSQSSDAHAHAFSNAGLWDSNGQAKPILQEFAKIKKQYLA